MAILISLADLFSMEAKKLEVVGNPDKKYPAYKALILGLIYPVLVVVFVQIIKCANKIRMNMIDLSMAYFVISSILQIIPSILVFVTDKGSFSWYFFIQGFVASFSTCVASTLADYGLGLKDAPQGPTVALLNMRIVIVLIFDVLLNKSILSAMQWVGLILGIAGILILSVPDHLLKCFRWIFQCC